VNRAFECERSFADDVYGATSFDVSPGFLLFGRPGHFHGLGGVDFLLIIIFRVLRLFLL